MYKHMRIVMMLCLILSGALCYAKNMVKMEERKDGHQVSIELIESTGASSSDKSNAIIPFINGHVLVVVFTENLGQVAVEIATAAGVSIECSSTVTPNGLQFYIPNAGNYIVTFTLSNGDVYAGEFSVTD